MNEDHPPRRRFHDELDVLQERLLEMAGIVERIIRQAADAVLERDASVADPVRAADVRVDELEIEIDERVVELLALQQPMATDLRRIVITNKISNDLERMADITCEMVSDALAAYVSRNAGTARMVCITDDKVDDLRDSMYRILVTHMLEDPKRLSGALELLLVSQNLERIADLATNVSEDVVFLVEGRTIKHGVEVGEG